jgi:hypothetical protein
MIPDGLADASEVVDLIDALRAADVTGGGAGAATGVECGMEAVNGAGATCTSTDGYSDS